MVFTNDWTIDRIAHGRAQSMLFICCLIPFWVSETVRTLGWMILLRESGVLPGLMVWLGLTPAPLDPEAEYAPEPPSGSLVAELTAEVRRLRVELEAAKDELARFSPPPTGE